ncbi:MAG: hypothetical protein ACPL2E_07375 [Conexivisphaera sp.]
MIIKEPWEKNAYEAFTQLLGKVSTPPPCPDYFSLTYISSLIISNSRSVLDKLVKHLPQWGPRELCLIRTNAPSYFQGRMKSMQREAVDRLKERCYVVLYNPRREFLNHAKFLIHYKVCPGECLVVSYRYYGSTNFTVAGLAHPPERSGNYEEYAVSSRNRWRIFDCRDAFYVRELLELLQHKLNQVLESKYVARLLNKHVKYLQKTLWGIKSNLEHSRGESRGPLYAAYVSSLAARYMTLALAHDLPGTPEVVKLRERLEGWPPELGVFEVEAMTPWDEEDAGAMAESLGLNQDTLRREAEAEGKALRSYMGALKDLRKAISRESWEAGLRRLEGVEGEHWESVGRYGVEHRRALERLLGWGGQFLRL